MIRWAREVLKELREINQRLKNIESALRTSKNNRNFIATGPHNS